LHIEQECLGVNALFGSGPAIPVMGKKSVVAAISQSRRVLYVVKYTRFGKLRAILEIAATKRELLAFQTGRFQHRTDVLGEPPGRSGLCYRTLFV
jgi:hypothetical protein